MRELYLGSRLVGEDLDGFVAGLVRKLEDASHEDAMIIADAYTVTAPATPVRTLNPATATVTDVANFLATFISDLQKRTINRVE
jgi:hypothetical protein